MTRLIKSCSVALLLLAAASLVRPPLAVAIEDPAWLAALHALKDENRPQDPDEAAKVAAFIREFPRNLRILSSAGMGPLAQRMLKDADGSFESLQRTYTSLLRHALSSTGFSDAESVDLDSEPGRASARDHADRVIGRREAQQTARDGLQLARVLATFDTPEIQAAVANWRSNLEPVLRPHALGTAEQYSTLNTELLGDRTEIFKRLKATILGDPSLLAHLQGKGIRPNTWDETTSMQDMEAGLREIAAFKRLNRVLDPTPAARVQPQGKQPSRNVRPPENFRPAAPRGPGGVAYHRPAGNASSTQARSRHRREAAANPACSNQGADTVDHRYDMALCGGEVPVPQVSPAETNAPSGGRQDFASSLGEHLFYMIPIIGWLAYAAKMAAESAARHEQRLASEEA
ncbi:MAG: hypothetical protein HY078_15245 [Elusimicrobia bacterium]|nr:hypothetical protein [Elusimicrobiota bacterium]